MKRPTAVRLSIPQPCHERWADMTPTERGRFCASCQKEVIDFTQWTADGISIFLSQNGGEPFCGSFARHQLRDYQIPSKGKRLFKLHRLFAALATQLILLYTTSRGQQGSRVESHITTATSLDGHGLFNRREVKIVGSVKDSFGLKIPMAEVVLRDSLGKVIDGVVADLDGNFEINLGTNCPTGDFRITVNVVGMLLYDSPILLNEVDIIYHDIQLTNHYNMIVEKESERYIMRGVSAVVVIDKRKYKHRKGRSKRGSYEYTHDL